MSALEDRRRSPAAQFDEPYSFPQSLEEELAGVLRAAGLFGRQARAVATRLGWGGGPATTLAKAAAGEGYTRERVRQLEARVRGYAGRLPVPLPLTAAALRLVENAAPIARKRIPGELARAGLSAGPFDFTGLRSAAELGGLELRICERDGIVVRTGEAGLVSDLETTVQRLVKKNGAGTVEALSRRLVDETVPPSTRRLLDVYADVTWLDERRGAAPPLRVAAAVRGLGRPARNSVGLYLCRSPVLKTVSRGRYSLRGHGEGAKMQAR